MDRARECIKCMEMLIGKKCRRRQLWAHKTFTMTSVKAQKFQMKINILIKFYEQSNKKKNEKTARNKSHESAFN